MVISTIVMAQMKSTNAQIFGEVHCDGESVPFINVYVKGSTIGTTTDQDGNYTLNNLPLGQLTIVAQGVGYKSQAETVVSSVDESKEIRFDLEEDVLNLDAVVVTADRNLTSRTEAPVIVNTLTSKLFETTQAINIADGLDFTPGLRMECNCQNCGFSQLRMNGLDGPYSQILMNSRPVFSGLAGVYGLELIPTNMVDRIEIVRGGGSALFGGNAIAGTVNIITKDPLYNSFTIDARAGSVGLGNEHGTTPASDKLLSINGSIVSDDMKSGLFFYGMARERDPFDENGDDFSELVTIRNTTFGISSFYKPSNRTKLAFDFYRIDEFRRGGNKFDYLPHETDITEQVDHLITGANFTFDLFTNTKKFNKLTIYAAGQKVDRGSYYGAEQDPDAYGKTNDFTTSTGAQYNMNFNETSSIILGIDNNHNKLEDVKLGANGNENSTIVNQFVNTFGSFAQYDLKYLKTKFSLGMRYDNYLIRDLDNDPNTRHEDIKGNVLAPRATFLWDISPTLQYRLSYAKGYRAPQIFDEDLHIEASGSRRVLHANSPDLTQETSHSINTSFNFINNFGAVMTEFLVEGFITRLVDPFAYEYFQIDSSKTYVQIRKNAEDGAYVAGVNLEFNAAFPNNISLQTGFTFQKSEYDSHQNWGDEEESVSKHFIKSPGQYGYLTLDWNPTKRFTTSFTSTYTGSMYVPHFGLDPISETEWELINSDQADQIDDKRQSEIEAILNDDVIEGERLEKTEQFLIFGIRLAYDFQISKETKLRLYGGVQNIFNQTQKNHDSGVYRDAGYIYGPCKPRTVSLGVKIGNMF